MQRHLIRLNLAAMLATVALVAGCTVGPEYRGAPPVAARSMGADAYVRAPHDSTAATPALATWWEPLNDAQLTSLIEAALANNPDIRSAQARLQQSRSGLREKRDATAPKIGASAAYLHANIPGGMIEGNEIGLYTVGFDATWEIDLFGGTRRAIQAAAAEANASLADLADVQVQLSAETAKTYVDLRDAQQRLAEVRESAKLEQQILDLTEQRRGRGVASDLDVERVRSQYQTTLATEVPLQAQVTEALDRLAVLTGKEPGELDATLGSAAPLPGVPASVAVGNPASLLRQRPDIRAAEWHLVASNAQVGERIAEWFPKLTLLGDIGFNGSEASHLVSSDNRMWVGAPFLRWSAFDFGRTHARVESARAAFQDAQAKYAATVLDALRDANVALSRYGLEREHVVRLRSAEQASAHAAELTQQRYRAGVSTALEWLDAERTRLAARQERLGADAELLRDYVALQKSLGLGWQPTGKD